ncbi:MAG: hypothetical protein ACOYW4_01865 [Bacillota bacterium]
MRRLLTTLAVVVAIAMAAPVMAAPNINLGGSLSTTFQMVPADNISSGISATSDLRLKLSMELAGGQQVQAFVGFAPIKYAPFFNDQPGEADPAPGQMDQSNLTPRPIDLVNQLTIEKAYLETTGPFLTGGQAVTTRFGDLAIDYSPYIAHISKTDGVIEGAQVGGVHLGPVELAGFYGWTGLGLSEPAVSQPLPRVVNRGIFAKADIHGIGLEGAALKVGGDMALVGGAQFAPMPGVDVAGTAAWDGANQALAVKAEAGIGAVPGLPGVSAKLGYRNFDPKFNPIYRDDSKDDAGNDINVVDLNAGKRGVNGEVATTISGVALVGNADWHEQRDNDRNLVGKRTAVGATATTQFEGFDIKVGAKTMWSSVNAGYTILDRTENADPEKETTVTLGLGRDIPIGPMVIDTRYDLTMSNIKPTVHELAASTAFDAPMLSGVGLSGNLRWADGQTTYLGQAKYAAPNGIEFIASYNKGYPGSTRAQGFSLTAGMKVEF